MSDGRIYPHTCVAARALEEIGDRWSLLVVRDLLLGPRRFTDLQRTLGGITPTRLTTRLRGLEAAGIVVRERPSSGREVWYRLTDAGRDLAPVLQALARWGLDHAFEAPRAGEPVHPEHVMLATRVSLDRPDGPEVGPVVWVWQFPGGQDYTLEHAGSRWTLTRGQADAATVTVLTTPEAWVRFLRTETERRLPADDIQLAGSPAHTDAFARAFGAALDRS